MVKQLISALCVCVIFSNAKAQELTVVNTDKMNAPVHIIFKGFTCNMRNVVDSVANYSTSQIQKINFEPTYKEQAEKAISEIVSGMNRIKLYSSNQTADINSIISSTTEDAYELSGDISTMLTREIIDTAKNVKTHMLATLTILYELKNLRTNSVDKFYTDNEAKITHAEEDKNASTATAITLSLFKAAVNYVEATRENAIAKTIDDAKNAIKTKILPYAPTYGCVTKITETKKEKVKALNINLGSVVSKNNVLQVYTYNNGAKGTKIGSIKVSSILGNNESACSVSSGAKDIYKYGKSGNTLIVVY